MRDLSLINEMMEARSLNVEPMEVPAPAIVSSTVVTVWVAAWLALSWAAMRAMAGSRAEALEAPGLGGREMNVRCGGRGRGRGGRLSEKGDGRRRGQGGRGGVEVTH